MSQEMQRRSETVARSIGTIKVPAAMEQQGRAQLRRMMERGEIASAFNPRREDGMWLCDYERLREPRSRTPWYIGGAATFIGGSVTLAYLVWSSRYVILALAATAVVVFVIAVRVLAGHSGGCVGLHCPGCKG